MKKYCLLFLSICSLCHINSFAQQNRLALKTNAQNFWYAGIIDNGYLMPLQPGYKAETENDNYNNQVQPLLLSSNGEVIWCDAPLAIQYTNDSIIVQSKTANIIYAKAGDNLKQAYQFASKIIFRLQERCLMNYYLPIPNTIHG